MNMGFRETDNENSVRCEIIANKRCAFSGFPLFFFFIFLFFFFFSEKENDNLSALIVYQLFGINPPKSYFSAGEQSPLKSELGPVAHFDAGVDDVS